MRNIELRLNLLCQQCSGFPGCRCFCRSCKGRCPLLVGLLLFSLAVLGLELAIWMPQIIQSARLNYLQNISIHPTCLSYCGSEWRFEGALDSNCCNSAGSVCKAKEECYSEQYKSYKDSLLACRIIFFCSFGYACLYVPYYLFRCIVRMRRGIQVENQEQLLPLRFEENNRIAAGNYGGIGPAVDRLEASEPYRNSMEGCAICLENFDGTLRAIVLQCSHRFHGRCIREWMMANRRCPVCRSEH